MSHKPGKVVIVGAGGVGSVVTQKCAALPEVFSEVVLASRTLEKCQKIQSLCARPVEIDQVDADNTQELIHLLQKHEPELLIHVALPYQDLTIMDACLATGVHYLDTANYEPRDEARFEYKWQWEYRRRFEEAGLMALLGSGFDPGVTNVFCAWASKHHFDSIAYIDILDCNAGDHGHPFATNFNPEINIREITQPGRYWEEGEWKEIEPMSVRRDWKYPEIGPRPSYLLYHEEMESLVKNIPGLKRIRFWMTFGDEYLTHLRVLQNVGMTSIEPVIYEGREIVPLQFLKAVLPEPASLGENYQGKTNIGCVIQGEQDGKKKNLYVYNICDHAKTYRELKAQAVSYTTGVPAMIGAKLMIEGVWKKAGVFNMEEFDPDPFMEDLGRFGLPWQTQTLSPEELSKLEA